MIDLKTQIPKIRHDQKLSISVGKSRKETNWKSRELLWSELVAKLSVTTRTHETYAEYRKASKPEQGQIKDIGGFVGGTLKGARRKAEAVAWRQIITLDVDFAKNDFWSTVEMLFGYGCCMYSTHAHSPLTPRYRLVIPLIRPITPDEYQAVARRVAADIGIDYFDDTTYQPHRLMYWPSTATDGEYIFRFIDADWLNPDKVLATYPDWTDTGYWPESSRVKESRQKMADKQGDPLSKSGVIGAFCRTYTINDAIETFLSDVYVPVGDGRYTYINGSTAGGLVIYDTDTFCYSHHGTDPIGGKLVNAFDLVRIHKFGDSDDLIEPGTPITSHPSYKEMVEFATSDDAVKRVLAEDMLARAQEDFATVEDWTTKLSYNKSGGMVANLDNLVLILQYDPNLHGIAYDSHKGSIVLTDKVPWRNPNDWKGATWSDDDDCSLRVYLDKVYKIYSPPKLNDAISAISHKRSFHPIKDYLNGLDEWDGIPRLEEIFIDYLGAEDSVYVREVTKKTFVAAVARVFVPGIKFDSMAVLVGKQSIGKSTLFNKLAGKWFNDSLSMNDMRDKTGAEKLQGYWILEIGELAGFRKAEVEVVKSFLSRQHDVYRPSYGRRTVEYPRQCILVGSTNNDTGFLRDSTGNRRFWPVQVRGVSREQAAWNLNSYTVDQIWAEALICFRSGETLFLQGEAEEEALKQQEMAMESDERLGLLKNYLNLLLPENWEDLSLTERRNFISGGDFGEVKEGTVRRDRVCVSEIWCEMMGRELVDIKRFDIDDIHGLIRQIKDWERYTGNKDGKLKFKIYGVQRAYVRLPKPVAEA